MRASGDGRTSMPQERGCASQDREVDYEREQDRDYECVPSASQRCTSCDPTADLHSEIRRQLRAGRENGDRFVMSTGSPITPGTPVEEVRLHTDLVREVGG
jgi:hypothetical protein